MFETEKWYIVIIINNQQGEKAMVHSNNNIELNVKLEKFIRTGLLQFGLFLLAPFEVQFTKEERMKLEEKIKIKVFSH